MGKWYTAVGAKAVYGDGKFYVRVGREEKVLSGMEMYLWTSLLWAFTPKEGIRARMEKLLQIAFKGEHKGADPEEFGYCFRRLCTRGLLAWCEGETAREAEERFFQAAEVEIRQESFADRFALFLNSMGNGNGIGFSLRAFRKNPLEKKCPELLGSLKKQGLIPKHLEDIQKKTMESGQGDQEAMALQEAFLVSVAGLYRGKLLVVRAVRREGQFEGQ